jgi:hypothetical protein
MVVARFISLGGWLQWVGLFFGGAVFSCVLMVGLKYAGFATRLEKLTARLVRQMVEGGLQVGEAQQLAQVIVCNPGADANQTRVVLQKTPLSPEVQEVIRETLENQVLPFLKKPITDQQTEDSGRRRFVSLWNRSFVLGLFTFAWFFVVPVPGLLVFTAPGGYRASMSLVTVLGFGIAAVGAALAVTIVGWLVEQWQFFGLGQAGLVGRVKHHYTAFQLLAIESGRLSSVQISRFYAMFTDTQTFFDQRSFAYAQQTLQRIESAMNAIQKSEQPGESP